MNQISRVRQFNRTITQHIGALDNHFLGRHRSLGSSRVLFETGESGIEIRELRKRLGLDSGYTSRLIKSLQTEGLLKINESDQDRRVRVLKLTKKGLTELGVLNRLSDQSAESLLEPLTQKQQDALVFAMDTIEQFIKLSNIKIVITEPTHHYAKKCIANYYQELSSRFDQGFDPGKSITANSEELIPPKGYLLVAQLYGQPIGCGALKCQAKIGEIKRMWVDSNFRGLGIGRSLLMRLEEIAKQRSLQCIHLETNETLKEAQLLYRKNGYEEVDAFNDEPYAHHWFEKKL